jgi:hypothetical protein
MLTRQLVVQARARLVRRVGAPRRERHEARVRAIQPEIDAARREHADDPQAQAQAVTAVYRAKGVSPFGGCSSAMVIPAVIDAAAILVTPRHQSPADWIAGIVTVRD